MTQLESIFSDIANSIRSKTGQTGVIYPTQMSTKINNVEVSPPIIYNQTVTSNFFTNKYNRNNFYKIFNAPITFDLSVNNLADAFNSFTNFNSKVTIKNSSIGVYSNTFYGCYNYNQPITFPGVSGKSFYYTFAYCSNFNQPLNLYNATDLESTLQGCSNFNSPVNITIMSSGQMRFDNMFNGCPNFNSPLYIDTNGNYGVPRLGRSNTFDFDNWVGIHNNYNADITLGPRCKYSHYLLQGDTPNNCLCNFNSNIIFKNQQMNITGLLRIDTTTSTYPVMQFNYPISLPTGCTSYFDVFGNCQRFNQPINLVANNISSYQSMFRNCVRFNQPVTIPTSLQPSVNGQSMFVNCTSLNSPIYIHCNNMNMQYMFSNCTNMGSNIYIYNCHNNNAYFNYFLNNKPSTKSVNILCKNSYTFYNILNANICGSGKLTWSGSTYNKYNATKNLYIIYNSSLI